MSGVIIEELDSSSDSGFATPKSDHSLEDFHEADNDQSFQEEEDDLQQQSSPLSSSNHTQDSSEEARCTQDKADSLKTEQAGGRDSPLASSLPKQADCNGTEAVTELDEESFHRILDEADRLKGEGNKLYTEGSYAEALEIYKQALKLLPESASHQRAVLFANSAAVRIKQEDFAAAAEEGGACLALDPVQSIQIKALTRRGLAYEKLDDLERALADYEKLVSLNSGDSTHKAAVRRLKPVVEERREKMKEEMMGKLKELGNTVLGKFGMSLDNFKAEKDPTTGSYSINFKQ